MPLITSAWHLHPSHRVSSPNGSDALVVATLLFHQQLRRSIREGGAGPRLSLFLSALNGLDPFKFGTNAEFGFLWIADLFTSGYSDSERYSMASQVITLLGKDSSYIYWPSTYPSWVSSLLSFLSLGEFHSTISTPCPEFLTLGMLLSAKGDFDLGAAILPVLAWTLTPTHPLKSRRLALAVFHRFVAGWFSSQMESVSYKDLDKLLQAVGDPFQFPDLPLKNGQHVVTVDYEPYEPMGVAVVLIEFASSDLWRNHLRRSNFASCEEILSTEEGRGDALKRLFHAATHSRPELLRTPAEIIAAIRRLEELQCPNTAEVVILWAWTANVVGYDAWGLIERITLNFYQIRGIRSLATLSRHITDTIMKCDHLRLLMKRRRPLYRPGGDRWLVPLGEVPQWWKGLDFGALRVAQVCQLRRLYHLFGYDPMTWKEAVAVEEVKERMAAVSGRSVTPTRFTDWACDYP